MARLLIIDAKYDTLIEVNKELSSYLKKQKVKSIALFASVQFTNLTTFIKQLKKIKIKVLTTKAKRTDDKIQILGCDCYSDSFKDDIIKKADITMYIGDGMFHPKALLLSQPKKSVLIYNPIDNKLKEITHEAVKKQQTILKKNIKKFLNADSIGILVTIKPGQQYFNAAKTLKYDLEKKGKKAYIFIDDKINLQQLENYPFINCWVNTACPRIGTDDIVNINQPMINLRDAMNPIKSFEELEK